MTACDVDLPDRNLKVVMMPCGSTVRFRKFAIFCEKFL